MSSKSPSGDINTEQSGNPVLGSVRLDDVDDSAKASHASKHPSKLPSCWDLTVFWLIFRWFRSARYAGFNIDLEEIAPPKFDANEENNDVVVLLLVVAVLPVEDVVVVAPTSCNGVGVGGGVVALVTGVDGVLFVDDDPIECSSWS